MTYLLDLNYTLVENSRDKRSPFIEQIRNERYRQWLVDLLRGHDVILATARPARYEMATLKSIVEKTGWKPRASFFNRTNSPPPRCKERLVYLLQAQGTKMDALMAIESNPRTREMYLRHGIKSVFIKPGEVWTSLPA
jgi:hypothetical protein